MTYVLDSVLSQAVNAVLPFFPYRCSLIGPPSLTQDTVGGSTGAGTSIVSDLPVLFESLRKPLSKIVAGQLKIVGTHMLYLQADANTSVITEEYEIHVDAYQDEAAKVFVRPVITEGAYSHLIQIAAVLKQ